MGIQDSHWLRGKFCLTRSVNARTRGWMAVRRLILQPSTRFRTRHTQRFRWCQTQRPQFRNRHKLARISTHVVKQANSWSGAASNWRPSQEPVPRGRQRTNYCTWVGVCVCVCFKKCAGPAAPPMSNESTKSGRYNRYMIYFVTQPLVLLNIACKCTFKTVSGLIF